MNQVNQALKTAVAEETARALATLKSQLVSKDGRRQLWSLVHQLKGCGGRLFQRDAAELAWCVGRYDAGVDLERNAMVADPDGYLAMVTEGTAALVEQHKLLNPLEAPDA